MGPYMSDRAKLYGLIAVAVAEAGLQLSGYQDTWLSALLFLVADDPRSTLGGRWDKAFAQPASQCSKHGVGRPRPDRALGCSLPNGASGAPIAL